MSRDTQERPWDMAGMLAHLFPKRQKISPAVKRQMFAADLIHRQLMEMALARFTWHGLPDSASALYIETLLLTHGRAMVGVDPRNAGVLALRASEVGPPNYQNEYAVVRATGTNYKTTNYLTKRNIRRVGEDIVIDDPNAVVIYNNATRTGDLGLIAYYAERLAELDTTIDINSMNARRNKIVYSNADTELGLTNILSEIAEGQPVIKVRDTNPMESVITTLDLSVHPDSIDRLHIFRGRMFNEAMMALGIDNTNQDKKERMVTDELGGNDDQVARIRSAALNQRRRAARQISQLIGSAVTVDYDVTDDPAHDDMPEAPGAATGEGSSNDVHNEAQ